MAFVKTTDKWTAIHAVINMWLKDKTITCNNCGTKWKNGAPWCCDDPALFTNQQVFLLVKRQNEQRRQQAGNVFAAGDAMRNALSMPPDLLRTLETYCKVNYGEKLWNNNKELHEFMRRFPVFTVPERI